jgi:hypothetical protein
VTSEDSRSERFYRVSGNDALSPSHPKMFW